MGSRILSYWRTFVIVGTPICLLPLILAYPDHMEARAGAGVILMAVYWVTEVLPLAITSLIPVALFPMMGILSTDEVCQNYMKAVNMMFIGGLIMAIAIEHCNMHKRIALRTMMIIGTSPNMLMLGIMFPTMFLSMWISNTATTAMITPIVTAILDELQAHENENERRPSAIAGKATSEHEEGPFDQETRRKSIVNTDALGDSPPPKASRQSICYFLSVAYAANIGGTGTLTGTATNLTFKGLFDSLFPKLEGLNFASWMLFNVPLMLVNTLLAWLWLLIYMGAFKKSEEKTRAAERERAVKEVITRKYRELGPLTVHQVTVTVLFVVLILLWFFRAPEFIPGWAKLVSSKKIKDATPAIFMVILLFIFPSNFEFLRKSSTVKPGTTPALVNWKLIHEKMPWGLVLLIGGGMAMADAARQSGLTHVVGSQLVYLKDYLSPILVVVAVCIATVFLTEVSSNTAVANILLPILAEMARGMRVHPLYFMIPATLTCSYAFMLPVATPPNAIVMAASNMSTKDMVRAGAGMNLICLITLVVLFPTLGVALYNCYDFPEGAEVLNIYGQE